MAVRITKPEINIREKLTELSASYTHDSVAVQGQIDSNFAAGFIVGGDITFSDSDDISLPDNSKILVGTGDDLQIYHDGSGSYIVNNVTAPGNLFIDNRADNQSVVIRSDDGSGGNANYIKADGLTGEVQLYHYGSEKLATKSTGIEVTGTITADGLDLANSTYVRQLDNASGQPRMFGMNSSNNTYIGPIDPYAGGTIFYGVSSDVTDQRFYTNADERLRISSNGDISFYDSTGTTAKFFWDASAERLGIGTTSPSANLHIASTGSPKIRIQDDDGTNQFAEIGHNNGLTSFNTRDNTGNGSFAFRGFNSAAENEYMRIDAAGNVGIGTTTPQYKLAVSEGSNGNGYEVNPLASSVQHIHYDRADANYSIAGYYASDFIWYAGSSPTEQMRLNANGNVGIGTVNPAATLDVAGEVHADSDFFTDNVPMRARTFAMSMMYGG